ncbi:T9SS outer membrane translocon Sov/SprA [Aureivirga marina]|uniref:T9SS outer membrane translocon Sov/SprA n=1 Tax=Aureivirga marina TaxID=1182451 RepID=UPI001E4D4BEE|nr:cell surface protein SprA [Aureivirga marina]
MEKNTWIQQLLLVIFFSFLPTSLIIAQETGNENNTKKDSLKYTFKNTQDGSLFLNNGANKEVIYDPDLKQYVILEKIGDYYITHPIYMSEEQYKEYRLKKDMLEYYKSKISALNPKKEGSKEAQKDLLPTYYVNSKFFESIFGGNTVEVNPQATILIKMGVLSQRVENPQLSERNRSSFTFDFDQQISASLIAKVGTRLQATINYDTQSTFNFQNILKLEYTPTEDDILQKIEVGNVSMPMKNSLIAGAQNLFGVKTQFQFGPTTVTGVFARQRSQLKTVNAQGSSTIEEFELLSSDYDDNKHFFLAQEFRENYNNALANLPLISSNVNITKIEVWVTNRNSSTQNVRNIVAIADLAEGNVDHIGAPGVVPIPGPRDPSNGANNIVNELTNTSGIRDIATASAALQGGYNMQQGRDFSLLENARLLSPSEYQLQPQLGYISLNRKLGESDILAVAFEYTVNGSEEVFKVGELSSDGVIAPAAIAVKLLRSEIITTDVPMWNLMMKNIYSLGAYQLQEEGFRFELLYKDDATGVAINTLQNAITGEGTNDPVNQRTIMNLVRLDRLDQYGTPIPGNKGNGYFDYIEGITVNSEKGYIIFPEVEPFGDWMAGELTDPQDDNYLFRELYRQTKAFAKNNFQQRDKYLLKGYYKSDSGGGGIPLGAFNVTPGSVRVTSGGRELVEGVDYVVDYQIGRVQIINPSLEASNAPIEVSVENNSTFAAQDKSFIGVDVQHKFSDKFEVGASFLNLSERPLTQKVNLASEPINNSIFGFNATYGTEVPFLTKLVNKLPNIDTDVPSNISVRGDFAYLKPGQPKAIKEGGEANAYIDDFEGSQIPLDISSPLQWYLASTPQHQPDLDLGGDANDLSYGAKRANLAWYTIDQLFYGGSLQPGNIDEEELSRAEVRRIRYNEIFPEQDLDITQSSIVRTLDLAYYPFTRGTYNYDEPEVGEEGYLTDPESRWGGIMRPLTTTNFDQANIEYIQFWIQDPYDYYSITEAEGLPAGVDPFNPANQVGDLYFNLGNISEDILKDNRKVYENGYPGDGNQIVGENVLESGNNFGYIPKNQSLLYAFDESDEARPNQDIGFDGLNDTREKEYFAQNANPLFASFEDPSTDNYRFYRSSVYDAEDASVLSRYQNFNKTQGNSPTIDNSPESYPTSATSYPDVEDVNKDQTMNTVESYWQFKVSMAKSDLVVGQNHIVDEKVVTVNPEDGTAPRNYRWLQFRIPVNQSGVAIGGISDFQSIRFIRMFMTKFRMPIVLRLADLKLVRGDWRRYKNELVESPFNPLPTSELNKFEVGVVNIEENATRVPIPYVLPPGIVREELQGNTTVQQQNEQSVSVKIRELPANEARGIYKNTSLDLRMYKKLKMFIHLEGIQTEPQVESDELKAIIRLGSDLNENFYQIEMPLTVTPYTATTPEEIWPVENNIEAALDLFGKLKLLRFDDPSNPPVNELYPAYGEPDPFGDLGLNYVIRVKGNPNLGNVKTMMLGVKNDSGNVQSFELWYDEFRASGFENDGGWATVVSTDANLADFADISATGRIETIGFGGIEQRLNERNQEDVKQYDIVTNVNMGKLLPNHWGIQLPFNYGISEEFRDPKYDPQFQDVLFDDAKDVNPNSKDAQDYTKRRSISLINVRKERNPNSTRKPQFYDVENLSVSGAYNEMYHKDYNVQKYLDQNVKLSGSYNYTLQPKYIQPLKNWSLIKKSKYLKLIRDFNFNLLPTSVSVNTNINRNYNSQQSRTLIEGLPELPELIQRRYMFDWDYGFAYDLSKSLQVNFKASNYYVNDQFEIDDENRVFDNIFEIGRPNNYHQKLEGTYKIPLDKIPYLEFVRATYTYTADFDWQAISPQYYDQIGNTIQNSNTHNISGDLNFTKLYRKIGVHKLFRKSKSKKGTSKLKRTPGLEKQSNIGITKNQNKRGRRNKLSTGQKVVKGLVDVVTSVKKAKISYLENNGTFLPGYAPEIGFLGRDNFGGGLAPTIGFVFGSQADIRERALRNGWLITRNVVDLDDINSDLNDPYYNKTYSRTHYEKLDYSLDVKPFKDLDVELFGSRIYTKDISQQLDVIRYNNSAGTEIREILDSPEYQIGGYSISNNMIRTAFDKGGDDAFRQFRENRLIISNRLAGTSTQQYQDGYGSTSQQVLLPAFLAAYSGQDANNVSLNAFSQDVPFPGWKLTYKGLMNFKWFKKNFRSFTVTHGYNSIFAISSYTNNLQYNPLDNQKDIAGNYYGKYLFTNVSMIEEFSPLVKVDIKMKNSFSFSGRINKDRSLTLNFDNNTLTQIRGTEYEIGIGYIVKDLKMKMRFAGKPTKLKGDLNLKATFSLRDDLTQIREIEQENDQITGGQKIIAIKFSADYNLSRSLITSFYYDQNISKYAISTTFPRKSISAGLSVRYTIGN